MTSDVQIDDWRNKIDKMKNEFDAEKVLSKMEVERSQNEFDIYSIIKKYGGKGKDHSWADELKENDAKPSYLSEIETESVKSGTVSNQKAELEAEKL